MFRFSKIILIVILLFLAGSCFARELEVPLPAIGTTPAIKTTPLLSVYVKYVFNFSIGIAGLIAFLMMVYGGFRYLISVGNPTKMSDAQDRIFAALIGLVVILGSYLLLTTINPQLVIIAPQIEGAQGKGVIIYARPNCQETDDLGKPGKPGIDFQQFSVLGSWTLNKLNDKVQSIYFFETKDELIVDIYPEENWKGDFFQATDLLGAGENNVCKPFSGLAKSIALTPQGAGVYLYPLPDGATFPKFPNPLVLDSSSPELGEYQDPKSLKFKKKAEEGLVEKYGVILHEHNQYGTKKLGQCEIIIDDSPDTQPFSEIKNIKIVNSASSITVLKQTPNLPDGGVTLCQNKECALEGDEEAQREFIFSQAKVTTLDPSGTVIRGVRRFKDYTWQTTGKKMDDGNREISAVAEVDHGYMIILFEDEDYQKGCVVVTEETASFERLKFNDKASSMLIIKGQRL